MDKFPEDLNRLKGIGEKRAQAFHKLGVFSLSDLISYFPRRYEDRTTVKPIGQVCAGESVCICAIVADEPHLSRVRRGMDLVRFRVYDDSAELTITFFNQPYVRNQLHRGSSYLFYGKMEINGTRRALINPVFEPEDHADTSFSSTGQIVPVYRLSAGLNQKALRQSIRQALDLTRGYIPEVLPASILKVYHLLPAESAYESIHFPRDFDSLQQARQRFVFEELFTLSCALGKQQHTKTTGIAVPSPDFSRFYDSLPFVPTDAQFRAIEEASRDIASGRQMMRLLQGDVGSGKTLVAAALVWQCAQYGYLCAMMAPTEILAEQHYHTLCSFLNPFGLRVALLTGSMPAAEKRQVCKSLNDGELDLIIGTHALLNEGLHFPKLALTITDEQHRFGVEQRAKLINAGNEQHLQVPPHVFVMSATPIPRTLALIIYGDLDVTVLDELPPGRKHVDTFCVNSSYHQRLLAFIRKLCGEGRQIFVVCPKVEDEDQNSVISEQSHLHSAVDYAKLLSQELPELQIACIHGRIKPKDKERVMQGFLNGETDVLVSTTVIEVGVDVPNAALMLIENAERFGLSQLHQLRGRVGRGQHKSYCVLVTDADHDEVKARMKIMCETSDGFRIAEEDLRLRGPGDFFGSRQHGLPEMHVADLGTDTETLLRCKRAADDILSQDPDLRLPENKQLRLRILRLEDKMKGTLN